MKDAVSMESFELFVKRISTSLADAGACNAFDAAAAEFSALGLHWTSFGIVTSDLAQLVRYRSNIPLQFIDRALPIVKESGGKADYVVHTMFPKNDPTWLEIASFTPLDEHQTRLHKIMFEDGVRVICCVPLAVAGLIGGVTGFALGAEASDRFANPALRQKVEFVGRLLAAYYDALDDATGIPYAIAFHDRRPLTVREKQALRLLAKGLQTARLAQAMGISEPMANRHLSNVRKKLGAKTREQAVALAIRHCLI